MSQSAPFDWHDLNLSLSDRLRAAEMLQDWLTSAVISCGDNAFLYTLEKDILTALSSDSQRAMRIMYNIKQRLPHILKALRWRIRIQEPFWEVIKKMRHTNSGWLKWNEFWFPIDWDSTVPEIEEVKEKLSCFSLVRLLDHSRPSSSLQGPGGPFPGPVHYLATLIVRSGRAGDIEDVEYEMLLHGGFGDWDQRTAKECRLRNSRPDPYIGAMEDSLLPQIGYWLPVGSEWENKTVREKRDRMIKDLVRVYELVFGEGSWDSHPLEHSRDEAEVLFQTFGGIIEAEE